MSDTTPKAPAFCLATTAAIYDWHTGYEIQQYEGYVVYYNQREPWLFYTGLEGTERTWDAIPRHEWNGCREEERL